MVTSARLFIVTLAASLLLATAIGDASAGRLSLSRTDIRVKWRVLEFRIFEMAIRCEVILEGRFTAADTRKAVGAIGSITRATVRQETCVNGIAAAFNGAEPYNGGRAAQTLNWPLSYESFSGTLPNITAIQMLLGRARFGIRDAGGFCTGQFGLEAENLTLRMARGAEGRITSLEPVLGRNRLSLFRRDAGLVCPATVELIGRGEVMLLQAADPITVTLI